MAAYAQPGHAAKRICLVHTRRLPPCPVLCRTASRRRLRRGWRGSLRLAAHLSVRDARLTLPGSVAVVRALARCEKGLPGDARRIVDPRLFRLPVTTRGVALAEQA